MCVYCMQHDKAINTEDIEVHHIIPIKDDYDGRLDSYNLISLCRAHHEQAEAGAIKRDVLQAMAATQEDLFNQSLPCL